MAANYKGSKITAVSNSRTQKLHIDAQSRALASWMAPAATLFVHIFTHREYVFPA
jgi:hypothetical protein